VSTLMSPFYFFSTEGYARGLPCRAKYIKHLKATTNPSREVILIECDERPSGYKSKYLVLVPRMQGDSFAEMGETSPVFANVLDGKAFLDAQEIDLSRGSALIADIGGIAQNLDTAQKWQVSSKEDAESSAFARGLRDRGTPMS